MKLANPAQMLQITLLNNMVSSECNSFKTVSDLCEIMAQSQSHRLFNRYFFHILITNSHLSYTIKLS